MMDLNLYCSFSHLIQFCFRFLSDRSGFAAYTDSYSKANS
jgi:hypothetical protein